MRHGGLDFVGMGVWHDRVQNFRNVIRSLALITLSVVLQNTIMSTYIQVFLTGSVYTAREAAQVSAVFSGVPLVTDQLPGPSSSTNRPRTQNLWRHLPMSDSNFYSRFRVHQIKSIKAHCRYIWQTA